jgi:hypothetical protein
MIWTLGQAQNDWAGIGFWLYARMTGGIPKFFHLQFFSKYGITLVYVKQKGLQHYVKS